MCQGWLGVRDRWGQDGCGAGGHRPCLAPAPSWFCAVAWLPLGAQRWGGEGWGLTRMMGLVGGQLQQLELGIRPELCAATHAGPAQGHGLSPMWRGSPSPRVLWVPSSSDAKGTGSIWWAQTHPQTEYGLRPTPTSRHPGLLRRALGRYPLPIQACAPSRRGLLASAHGFLGVQALGCSLRSRPSALALASRPGGSWVLNAALFWSCFLNQLTTRDARRRASRAPIARPPPAGVASADGSPSTPGPHAQSSHADSALAVRQLEATGPPASGHFDTMDGRA